jgi:leader peptidase (prepilin peptidase) / N-methyltransferase
MEPIYFICYGLLGLIIGSFLNVCIYRIPLGKSIVFPGSGCPKCKTPIRPYDNIPVLSYLFLRGKCRACGNPISPQYPLVELLAGFAFYFCALQWQFQPPTFVNSLFLSILIILIFTDYHHQILPDKLTIPGAIAGLLLSPFQTPEVFTDVFSLKAAEWFGINNFSPGFPLIASLLSAIIGGGILFLVAIAYEKLRKRQGMGMGDIKMMSMVGAFLGWRLALLSIFAGSLIGTILAVFLIVFRNMNLQSKLAFGVFLGIGSAFSLFYGLPFLRWYLNIFQ